MNLYKSLIVSASATLLFGCFEPRLNTTELCAKYPKLNCKKLNMNDGQCRVVRTDLIWHRKTVLDDPTAQNKIQEFKLLSDYQKCLDLAAQIEPTKIDNKKEIRFQALMHTYEDQKRLLKELGKDHSPEALYFMWTQGDSRALRRFLSYEGSKKLNTPELQYALATFYILRDKEKTVSILHKALKMGPEDSELIANIVESLATVNQSLKRSEHAYIWVLVGRELGLPVASDRNLHVLYQFEESRQKQLEEMADDILSAIEDKKFSTSYLPRLPK
ncbi:DUF2989 domain-containing protein [Vibrio sp. JC009]|uniref:DUF2989 domain-containing protein n=1 Tax=Vibrio sp. JC009 TaxID=2912314 RepID=UPI0023AFF98A|nr:DUF2989 domain-containing protein [Vibrio sp. JC009]WED20945.1 DUF2989 domain-containing protein [Vibrio sp. JC009]